MKLSVKIFCLSAVAFFSLKLNAQKDSTLPGAIQITSAYKPVLRNAVKSDFSASPLPADTVRRVQPYQIPAQNLFFAYEPVTMPSLALAPDTSMNLGSRNFVKIGYGNLATPFAKAGISLGDGRTSLLNFTGGYISSKNSKLEHQNFSEMNFGASANFYIPKNEVYGSFDYNAKKYNLYGYDHSVYTYKSDDVRQNFTDIVFKAGVRNSGKTELGINYNPNVSIGFFGYYNKLNETNLSFTLPVSKKLNEQLAAAIVAEGDITNFKTAQANNIQASFSNNLFQLKPALSFYDDNVKVRVGIVAAWDNTAFAAMPDVTAEAKFPDVPFTVLSGLVGRFVKNNFRNLEEKNPYLTPVYWQLNTKETEIYGGIKTTLAKRFTLTAKAGMVNYRNLPLFINDTTSATGPKGFVVVNELKANNFRVMGDIGYDLPQKFSLNAGLTVNAFASLKDNAKPWHVPQMELRASANYMAMKKLLLKANWYAFSGSDYLQKGNIIGKTGAGNDLSFGAEYLINKKISAWANINNFTNNKYSRWYSYPVYGTNVVGGVIFKF